MAPSENIIFGVNPILEKLHASPDQILELYVAERTEGSAAHRIIQLARARGCRVVTVLVEMLDRLAGGGRHQGVVARVEAFRYQPFEELLQEVIAGSAPTSMLFLDGLTDPRNFGALLRTAEAAGVSHVVIPKDRSVDVTPVVIKASAGAAQHVKISKVTNMRRSIIKLKALGFWVVGLDVHGPDCLYDKEFPERLIIALGSEGKGLRPIILAECDFVVSIPMLGRIASLNVGVAGGVLLYELVRQRRMIDKRGAGR